VSDAWQHRSEAGIGFAATTVSLLVALTLFPEQPSPRGALALPAMILSAGIVTVPILRAIRRSPSLLYSENLVAMGFVFWLLLDLIQGATTCGTRRTGRCAMRSSPSASPPLRCGSASLDGHGPFLAGSAKSPAVR
jgi:hypothetical protein